jgi:large subunit ribosomal protein L35
MRSHRAPSKGALQCLRSLLATSKAERACHSTRPFTTTPASRDQAKVEASPKDSFYRSPDPATVFVPRLERRLTRAGTPPIGSRRRRVALQGTSNVPFEQLPYQCFQEARKILLADREEKLKQIQVERARIARLKDADPELSGGELRKQNRLRSMSITLEKLKILADINDPMVKKRFEDGLGRVLILEHDFQLLIVCYRGHEQAYLPLPCRSQMARIPTPRACTTNHTDENYTRCRPELRAHCRCQARVR